MTVRKRPLHKRSQTTTIFPSEHDEQKALIKWARGKGIDLLFAIPNGGYRSMSVAKKLKAEGVMPGIPDLQLAIPRNGYHGLFIEMKSMKGVVSKLQKAWITALNAQGYKAVICRGFEEGKATIKDYLTVA